MKWLKYPLTNKGKRVYSLLTLAGLTLYSRSRRSEKIQYLGLSQAGRDKLFSVHTTVAVFVHYPEDGPRPLRRV